MCIDTAEAKVGTKPVINLYSALEKLLNKIKYFLTSSKIVLILNALYEQNGS